MFFNTTRKNRYQSEGLGFCDVLQQFPSRFWNSFINANESWTSRFFTSSWSDLTHLFSFERLGVLQAASSHSIEKLDNGVFQMMLTPLQTLMHPSRGKLFPDDPVSRRVYRSQWYRVVWED